MCSWCRCDGDFAVDDGIAIIFSAVVHDETVEPGDSVKMECHAPRVSERNRVFDDELIIESIAIQPPQALREVGPLAQRCEGGSRVDRLAHQGNGIDNQRLPLPATRRIPQACGPDVLITRMRSPNGINMPDLLSLEYHQRLLGEHDELEDERRLHDRGK